LSYKHLDECNLTKRRVRDVISVGRQQIRWPGMTKMTQQDYRDLDALNLRRFNRDNWKHVRDIRLKNVMSTEATRTRDKEKLKETEALRLPHFLGIRKSSNSSR